MHSGDLLSCTAGEVANVKSSILLFNNYQGLFFFRLASSIRLNSCSLSSDVWAFPRAFPSDFAIQIYILLLVVSHTDAASHRDKKDFARTGRFKTNKSNESLESQKQVF